MYFFWLFFEDFFNLKLKHCLYEPKCSSDFATANSQLSSACVMAGGKREVTSNNEVEIAFWDWSVLLICEHCILID